MTNFEIRRYGDPAAPRFGLNRGVTVLVIVMAVVGLALGGSALIHWIQVGDELHLRGSAIGVALAILIVAGAAIGWTIYWHPLAREFRATRKRFPEALVLGARIPNIDGAVLAKSWPVEWPPSLAPQRAVLRINGSGVDVLSVRTSRSLLELSWAEVTGFAPVEYVESGVAYQGLAIEGPTEGSALILQVISPSFVAKFPRGKALSVIAQRANEQRPSPH